MIAQFFQLTNQIVYLDEGMGDTSLLTMRAVSLCLGDPNKALPCHDVFRVGSLCSYFFRVKFSDAFSMGCTRMHRHSF